MPQPNLPPTPAASTEISGQEKPRKTSLEPAFTLPPPANAFERDSPMTTESSATSGSVSSYNPATPTSPTHKALKSSPQRKRTSSGSNKKSSQDFNLPPPPSRERKIIQMKPKSSQPEGVETQTTKSASSKIITATAPSASASKRKQPSTSSVAGRKIARKTAHSLIERRRRSKMNEEFDTLKNMIPACEGQEMHKLAILQASIDYVRYLEKCVKDLKSVNRSTGHTTDQEASIKQGKKRKSIATFEPRSRDVDEQEALPRAPSSTDYPRQERQYSFASSTTTTTHPSPAFGPSTSQTSLRSPIILDQSRTQITPFMTASGFSSAFASASPSPNILPQAALQGDNMNVDRDTEATAALLMLTHDRRGTGGLESPNIGVHQPSEPKRRATGMSVRELLST